MYLARPQVKGLWASTVLIVNARLPSANAGTGSFSQSVFSPSFLFQKMLDPWKTSK